MSEAALKNAWIKLNKGIELLQDNGIIHRSNPLYAGGDILRFRSESNLVENYLFKKLTPYRLSYSAFSQLKNAFNENGQRNYKYSVTLRNYKLVTEALDDLIIKVLNHEWAHLNYFKKKSRHDLIDPLSLSLLSGTYVGHFMNQRKEMKRFLFVISETKTRNVVLIGNHPNKVIYGDVWLIEKTRLFFVLKTDSKNSPEIIICHMGSRLVDQKKISHFIGISTWYDYSIDQPSSSVCVFYKVSNDIGIPSAGETQRHLKTITSEVSEKIKTYFDTFPGNTFFQLKDHFLL